MKSFEIFIRYAELAKQIKDWRMKKKIGVEDVKSQYRIEQIQCVDCFTVFKCQPDNPEDLCECPKCSEEI